MGALLLLGACGAEGPVQVPGASLLVDLPTPSGWVRLADVPVATGGRAVLAIEPAQGRPTDPWALVLVDSASGLVPASRAAAALEGMRAEAPDLALDSSLSRTVQGNQGYLVQYRIPSLDGRVARELFFTWRGRDCRVVLSRRVPDTASQRILREIEDGLVLN